MSNTKFKCLLFSVVAFLGCSEIPDEFREREEAREAEIREAKSKCALSQPGVIYDTPVNYEGETYKTVVIGTQTWMARNLNYSVDGSKCYDNKEANCKTYGKLYNWATAMALPDSCNERICASLVSEIHRGICPSGWHIPSRAEWTQLMDFIEGRKFAGIRLRAQSGWNEYGNGTDSCGFSALPGGKYSSSIDSFFGIGGIAGWWNSSESSDEYDGNSSICRLNDYWWDPVKAAAACAHILYMEREAYRKSSDGITGNTGTPSDNKDNLQSVRCLQDDPSHSSSSSSLNSPTIKSSSSVTAGTDYTIECTCPGNGQCQMDEKNCKTDGKAGKTVTLKADECVEINIFGYDNQHYLPEVGMRCEARSAQQSISVSLTLYGKTITATGSDSVFTNLVPIGKIKLGDNEFGPLCLTAISGTTNIKCNGPTQ